MKRIVFALAIIVCVFALINRANAVHYSKLGIVTAAKAAGKWEVVKKWIAENNLIDEWQAAAYFSDEYPLFANITNKVVKSGIATREEIDAFLVSAKDTAPDAILSAAYSSDMESSAGRKRWHGGFTSRFETNVTERTIKRIDTYEDGYVYVEKGRGRRYLTPEEEAERAARRKTATIDDRIDALKSRIAELENKRASTTNELEAAHATIEIAAKKKTLERLEASRTNTVNIIITP